MKSSGTKINEFVNEIMNDAGWATDDYILDFCPKDFTDSDIYNTLQKLAHLGILFEEDYSLEAEEAAFNGKFPPESRRITPKQVEERYGNGDGYMTDPEAAK